MVLGEVVGKIVATAKAQGLQGKKILIVAPICNGEVLREKEFVSIDSVGAGIGDQVLVTSGSVSRYSFENKEIPVDSAVVAIIDSVERG